MDLVQRQRFKLEGVMQMREEIIGTVSDFFARPVVAAIELTAALKLGDKIHIKGHTTDLELDVESMQINNVDVKEAEAGNSVGVKMPERARKGDSVFKILD
jgi:putative protease